eukprot:gene4268-8494_t
MASQNVSALSNSHILAVFTLTFFIFVVAEIIGALLSNSLSLLGDAAAMSVDVFAYLCNLFAEHCRNRYGSISRNMMLVLEVGIPCISISALLGVTVYIFWSAVMVLEADVEAEIEKETVNIYFLYGFSVANLFVDVICSALVCYKGRDIIYHAEPLPLSSSHNNNRTDAEDATTERKDSTDESPPALQKNLNMISALTHVGGDTLRSFSVLTAAFVSSFAGINSDVADAWASIMVTATILLIVLPLLGEIQGAYTRIMQTPATSSEYIDANRDTAFGEQLLSTNNSQG